MTRGSSCGPAAGRRTVTWLAVVAAPALAVGVTVGVARAHVAPSTDTNNRYLKVELRPRELRIALTIYFGELPGARQRRLLDRDRDGTISPAEASAFGELLRAQVAASIGVDVDGARPDGWRSIEVGLGTPATTGGAFSVDLELRLPLAGGGEHTLRLADRLELSDPGEAHLRIEPAPGVTVLAAHADAAGGVHLEETATGRPLPPGTIRWRAPPDAGGGVDAASPAPASSSTGAGRGWLIAGGVALLALGLAARAGYLKMKG